MEKYHTKTFTKIALAFLVASIGASFGNLMQVPTASASSNAAILSQLITQFNNCDESGTRKQFCSLFQHCIEQDQRSANRKIRVVEAIQVNLVLPKKLTRGITATNQVMGAAMLYVPIQHPIEWEI